MGSYSMEGEQNMVLVEKVKCDYIVMDIVHGLILIHMSEQK